MCCSLRCGVLRYGSLEIVWLPLVRKPGGTMHQQARRFFLHDHLRNQFLVHLVLADLLSELLSLIAIIHCSLACGACHAQRACGAIEPRLIQLPHADFETIPFFAEQVFTRKLEILEGQFTDGGGVSAHCFQCPASYARSIERGVESR